MVSKAGIEPACLAARDFKSLASTYFATWTLLKYLKLSPKFLKNIC